MNIKTIEWKNNAVKLIDQSRLPQKLSYLYIRDIDSLRRAIREMKVRGAPALGAAAALGVYLGIKDSKLKDFRQFSRQLDKVAAYLAAARPTARNLFWGIERACSVAVRNRNKPVSKLKELILKEALKIIAEDRESCRRLGSFGAKLIKDNDRILTICNAGALATTGYGTALGVIYSAKEKGRKLKVFACETRPMLQGARLTTWELEKGGVDVSLLCDNMAAGLMQQGRIDKIIVGADRIAKNGDTANKIGTYSLAVLAYYHKLSFYVAAPASTFDLGIASGKEIKIEQRSSNEVKGLFFKKPIAGKNIKAINPAFDVTPASLVTAFITDKGIIRPPYQKNIKKAIKYGIS